MPYVNVHGVNLYYEEYGKGPAVILTPGGRVDRNGLRPMAALLSPKCRVILHDRRNCGRSDVVIGGELSEQHLWAEEMAGLLVQIGAAPAYAAGGSAGSRTSLTLAVRHPEVVKGVFIWEVSGGPRSGELMAPGYYGQYIAAAERGGMAAVAGRAVPRAHRPVARLPDHREQVSCRPSDLRGSSLRRRISDSLSDSLHGRGREKPFARESCGAIAERGTLHRLARTIPGSHRAAPAVPGNGGIDLDRKIHRPLSRV